MAKIDAARIWSLNYQLLSSVINSVAGDIMALGLEPKELFILSEIDEHPFPAELASTLCIPKPTVTVYLKNLEAAGFVKREIDAKDLRRHRLTVTAAGRKVMAQGLSMLSSAYNVRLAKLTSAEQNELKVLLEKMTSA